MWSTQGARSLAENPIYKGILRCTCGCGDSKFIKELAVVSESLWTKAQPATGPKSKGRKDHGKSLLAGLLVCRTCGKTMSHGSTGKYGFYRCRSGDRCPAHAAVSAPLAEGYLKEEALWAFATGGLDAGRASLTWKHSPARAPCYASAREAGGARQAYRSARSGRGGSAS